jgi:hypothetical protein
MFTQISMNLSVNYQVRLCFSVVVRHSPPYASGTGATSKPISNNKWHTCRAPDDTGVDGYTFHTNSITPRTNKLLIDQPVHWFCCCFASPTSHKHTATHVEGTTVRNSTAQATVAVVVYDSTRHRIDSATIDRTRFPQSCP